MILETQRHDSTLIVAVGGRVDSAAQTERSSVGVLAVGLSFRDIRDQRLQQDRACLRERRCSVVFTRSLKCAS